MNKQVIHIFGASGAGTSTMGRYIAAQMSFFFMDTDDYFWAPTDPPYTTKRSISDRLDMMRRNISEHDHVVIAGSLADWGDVLIPLFTLAVRVETETPVRIERLKQREQAHFGPRISPGGDMYQKHREFMAWATTYDDGGLDMRSRQKHDAWQKLLLWPLIRVDGALPPGKNFELIQKVWNA